MGFTGASGQEDEDRDHGGDGGGDDEGDDSASFLTGFFLCVVVFT